MVIDVLANDYDPEGDAISLYGLGYNPDFNGVINFVNINGRKISYTPNSDFIGEDTFEYYITDDYGNSVVGYVNVFVSESNSPNNAPVAADDAAVVDEDASVVIDVLANDSDADDDALSVASVTQGANGAVVINGDGTLTYTPDAGYFGADSFTYSIDDNNGGSDTATVNVTVNEVNDPPPPSGITPIVDGVAAANALPDPSGTLNGLDAISVSVWVQASQVGTDAGIFDTEVVNNTDNILTMRYDASGYLGGGSNLIKVALSTNEGVVEIESSSNVQTTMPQHLVMTWESGGALKLYINGVEDTPSYASPLLGGAIAGVQDLILGSGSKGVWGGSIDDFEIYDVALDAGQALALYNGEPLDDPDALSTVYNGTNGADIMHGSENDDILYGEGGDDILYGEGGYDTLFGGGGADSFVFESVSAFDDADVISDFSTIEGDALDIADLLTSYDPLADAITDFVQITDDGTDSTLAVDVDGGADDFVTIATLLNVTGLSDEAALETNGNLITV